MKGLRPEMRHLIRVYGSLGWNAPPALPCRCVICGYMIRDEAVWAAIGYQGGSAHPRCAHA